MLAASRAAIATTPIWRARMKAARKDHGLTQMALADLLGIEQSTISAIESGRVPNSRSVPAISAALGIPNPVVSIEDAADEEWLRLGRELHDRDPEQFELVCKMLESQLRKK